MRNTALLCFSKKSDLDEIRVLLVKLRDTTTCNFISLFYPRRLVEGLPHQTAILDLLDEVLGTRHALELQSSTFMVSASAIVIEARKVLTDELQSVYILGDVLDKEVQDQLELAGNKAILMEYTK